MQEVQYAEEISADPKKRSSGWLVDAGLILGAAIGVAIVVPPLGIWWHRSHNPDATIMTFTTANDPDAAEAQAGPTGSLLLWVARNGDATVYLFGSYNSASPIASGWMDQRLMTALDNANRVVFETDAYPDIRPADKVTPHPDAVLYHRAAALEKVPVGLKKNSVHHVPAAGMTDEGFEVPVVAWRTGDQKALTDSLSGMALSDPARYDKAIVKQNQAWLPMIEKELKVSGASFVTVGATHLIGKDGLVAKLRAHGYSVTRLDSIVRKPSAA